MNDAAGPTAQVDYKAALRAFITRRDQQRPQADVILCGPSSTDDPARSTIANYRQWASEVQAEYGTAKGVYYVDLSQAYASTDTAQFAEAATPRVHPNISGHGLLADLIYRTVKTTRWYQRG
jgi:lysophospholipase L1-like esterase